MPTKTDFQAISKRIEELIQQSSSIPPSKIIQLLQKANNNPLINVNQEIALLQEKYKNKAPLL